jgi:soluble epoxide hydrolase/lipid-phosphate phosphatase
MPQYVPADQPFLPTDELGFLLATFRYQAYFNSNSDAASKELTTDIRRTVRAVLRTVDSPPPVAFLKSNESFLQAWDHVKEVYIVF